MDDKGLNISDELLQNLSMEELTELRIEINDLLDRLDNILETCDEILES